MSLQSDNTSSGSTTTAAATITATTIWKTVPNVTSIQYTVPEGKYFKGYVGHSSSQRFKINGQYTRTYYNLGRQGNESRHSADHILGPGTTVQAETGSNMLMIYGIELPLPTSANSPL